MSIKYIDGSANSLIQVRTSGNTLVETIELDLCGVDGLKKRKEHFFQKHDMYEYSYTKWDGFYMHYTLSWTEYSRLENTVNIERIKNYLMDSYESNYKIILFPRKDVMSIYDEVIFEGEEDETGIMNGGINAPGNTGYNLKLRSKYLRTEIVTINPNDLNVSLEDFATV